MHSGIGSDAFRHSRLATVFDLPHPRALMSDPLFDKNETQIIARCLSCGYRGTVSRADLPEGLLKYVFCRQAACTKCGSGRIEVDPVPLPRLH